MKRNEMLDSEKIEKLSRCMKALANPIRLKILFALRDGEMAVLNIKEKVSSTQSNISQHLCKMQDKDILTSRKDGNQVYYRIKNKLVFELFSIIENMYCRD